MSHLIYALLYVPWLTLLASSVQYNRMSRVQTMVSIALCQNVLIWQMQQNISYSATAPLKLAVNVASTLCSASAA